VRPAVCAAWMLMCAGVACLVAAGCGGGAAGIMLEVVSANASPQCTGSGAAITCTVDEGQPLGFVATLANDTKNLGVTWTLTGTTCAGSGCGTLMNVTTSSVTYVAPTPIGATLSATLKANANANSGVVVTITLTIEPPPTFPIPAQVLQNGLNGIPYNQTITASGGVAPLTFSVSAGSLPAGLTLNSTGSIVGVPTASGTSTFTVQVKDSGTPLTATQVFSFSINPAQQLSIQTTSLPNATTGVAYSHAVSAQGGVPPITWSVVPGQGTGLPAGLTLNTTSGLISGTTTAAGLFTFTVQAQDSTLPTNQTAQRALALNVEEAQPLTINTSALGNGTTGTPYTANLQATGGVPPYTWSVSTGLLPSGLTLDPNTGVVSGTPIIAATSKFSVVAMDSQSPTPNQTPPEPLSITIGPGAASADLTLLNGTYSFVFNGFDCQGYVSIAGAITASGSGGTGTISAGLEDTNRFSGVALGASLTGTYTVGSDGRGTMQLIATDNLGRMVTSDYLLALESDGSVRFIESDATATPNPNCAAGTNFTHGAGIMRPQTNTNLSATNLSGHYAFGFSGQDLGGNPAAIVGTVFADGTSMITTGPGPGTSMVDFNDAGLYGPELNVSGTFMTNGSFNRGTMSLTIPNPNSTQSQLTLRYAFYFVSDSDLFFVSIDTTDATHPRTAGEMLRQSETTAFDKSALLGTSVASGAGTATGPVAKAFAGLLTATPGGNASLTFDQNSGGTIIPASGAGNVSGNYSVLPNGRVDLSSLNAPFAVVYLTGVGQGFLMGADASVVSGLLEQQNAGPAFTNAGGQPAFTNAAVNGEYGISGQAATDNAVLNIVGQALANGAGEIGGTLDESGPTGAANANVGQSLAIVYNTGSNGRGQMTVSGPPGGLPPGLAFYIVTSAKFRAVSTITGDVHPTVVFFDH
jgi:Putative Ig domain